MRSVEEQYPHVVSWVQDGWVEIGYTDYDDSFIRVLDIGGEVWTYVNVPFRVESDLPKARMKIGATTMPALQYGMIYSL